MYVVKVLSHNAVLVKDDEGRKGIATGKGIAFDKAKGDPIDEEKMEMLYIEYNPRIQEIVRNHL